MDTSKHIIDIPDVHKIGVYAIRNKKNGKNYIGSSVNIYDRLEMHRRNIEKLNPINLEFANDLKNVMDAFDFEFVVLETFEDFTITETELREKELEYIQKYNSFQNGYNISNHPPALTGRYGEKELLTSEKNMRKEWIERFSKEPNDFLLMLYGLNFREIFFSKENLKENKTAMSNRIALEVIKQEILKRMQDN